MKNIKITKNRLYKITAVLLIMLAFVLQPAGLMLAQDKSILDALTFNDLVKLSQVQYTSGDINTKVNKVLYTPIVDNSYNKNSLALNHNNRIGDFLRVASWNIERGLNLDNIKLVLTSPEELKVVKNRGKYNAKRAKRQMDIIKKADIMILNEVDIGMPRTEYKNVAEELAKTLGYSYAFGAEFVEVDPSHLGLEDNPWSEENILFPDKKYTVDKSKYKGLHGNAIISRFPIKNARILRLPNYYDWNNNERRKITEVEYIRREAAFRLFREDVLREIRRGSRIALIADIEVPGYDKPVTIVATHLENRTVPQNRYEQIKAVLESIKNVDNPVILAGDFNTTLTDASPTSIKREVSRKITDPQFLAKQAILLLIPYSVVVAATDYAATFIRTYKNPTVPSIPIISQNRERKLFSELENFRFADGGKFDFSGDKLRSSNRRGGLLADSNQRDFKGFTPTFLFERSLFIGKYRLDWIFVKPETADGKNNSQLEPFYGRTLTDMNYAFGKPLSDHSPITADLPLNSPTDAELKINLKHKNKNKNIIKSRR